MRRRLLEKLNELEEDDMSKWKYLGEVTVEEETNTAYLEMPDDITEVLLVATQLGGDSAAQSVVAFAWRDPSVSLLDVGFSVGNTGTSTTNQRAVVRLRKIELEDGTSVTDCISIGTAAGASSLTSGGTTNFTGNKVVETNGNAVGLKKAATANVLPAGISFYVIGR